MRRAVLLQCVRSLPCRFIPSNELFPVSVFTIGLTLLRTNLCAIHRALQMLRTDSEPSTTSDPFFLSMAHIYQDNVATLLADVQDFSRIQATVFVPRSQKRPFLPPHISTDDVSFVSSHIPHHPTQSLDNRYLIRTRD